MLKRKRKYRCPHCKKTVLRVSDKQWIDGFCLNEGRESRMMVVKPKRKYEWVCTCNAGECFYDNEKEAYEGRNSKFCGAFIGITKRPLTTAKEMDSDG